MKKIVTAYKNRSEILEITEAFNALSVETVCCDIKETGRVMKDFESEAVFSIGFDRKTAVCCFENGIRYISWVLNSPAPELFVPEILYPTNRIYTADHCLYRILNRSGLLNVFYQTAGFKYKTDLKHITVRPGPPVRSDELREKISFILDDDENKYLLGIERSQELCHTKNLFFNALGTGLINKIHTGLKLPCDKDPVSKRYFISECLLRGPVKEREIKRTKGSITQKDCCVFSFDDTGVESLSALLKNKMIYSDGCGLSDPRLLQNVYVIIYEDIADLVSKVTDRSFVRPKYSEETRSDFMVKNAIRKMIFS